MIITPPSYQVHCKLEYWHNSNNKLFGAKARIVSDFLISTTRYCNFCFATFQICMCGTETSDINFANSTAFYI